MSPLVKFKFKRIDDKGERVGFLSEKGRIGEHDLTMGNRVIPLWKVKLADRCPGHLVLHLDGEPEPLIVAFTGGNGPKVLSTLNLRSSAAVAQWHQQALIAQGKGNAFSSVLCLHCGATNQLSGFRRTPQAYCRYCDTVFTIRYKLLSYEGDCHTCGTCGVYGLIKEYTSFLIMFAPHFVDGKIVCRRECTNCMKGRVWKTLAANIPFFIGTPLALWQVARAYWPASGPLARLDYANRLVKKKRLEKAIRVYEMIEQKVERCAAVRYNHARALYTADRPAEAVRKLEQALAECANFRPAYVSLMRGYELLRMTDRLNALLQSWSYAESLGAGQ